MIMGTGRLPIFVGRTGKTSGKQARGLAKERKRRQVMKYTGTVLSVKDIKRPGNSMRIYSGWSCSRILVSIFHFTAAFPCSRISAGL